MQRPLRPPAGLRAHLPDALRGLGVTDACFASRECSAGDFGSTDRRD